MSREVGTREWARTGRGALRRRERLGLARQAVAAQLADLPGRVRAHFGGGPGRRIALSLDREPPDTPAAKQAWRLAQAAYPTALLGHCLRCWLWGDVFAQLEGLRHDPETLYIASLLHDIALTDEHRPTGDAGCFAAHGGEVARVALAAADEALAERVAEAISLHMNVRVPAALGTEAHLLHAGAHLDAGGTRAGDVPRAAVSEILARHPRDGFAGCFTDLMRREATERPRSRAAVLWRLGMPMVLARNPLDRAARR